MKSSDFKPRKYYRSIILTIGLIISLSGLLVIIGWSKNIYSLQTFGLGVVPQKANLGFGFLLSGISLILLQYTHHFAKLICRVLSIIIVILGILTSLEILFKFDFGIDNLLFSNSPGPIIGAESTRMAFNAAISLVLVGIIQIALSFKTKSFLFFIEFCLVFAFSISLLGLIGFIFGLAEFSESTGYKDMAILATLLFIITCVGLFFIFFHEEGIIISIDQQLLAGLVFIGTTIVYKSRTY